MKLNEINTINIIKFETNIKNKKPKLYSSQR